MGAASSRCPCARCRRNCTAEALLWERFADIELRRDTAPCWRAICECAINRGIRSNRLYRQLILSSIARDEIVRRRRVCLLDELLASDAVCDEFAGTIRARLALAVEVDLSPLWQYM